MSYQTGILRGSIRPVAALRGTLAKPAAITPEVYDGAYSVTPKTAQAVVLATENRLMQKDVTVLKIPQFEVSNEAGGTTFIIGEEYYG